MNITLTLEPTYTATGANGKTISGLREVETWNGMTKLVDSEGRMLIVAISAKGPFESIFVGLLGPQKDDAKIIGGHPDLIAQLAPPLEAAPVANGCEDAQADAAFALVRDLLSPSMYGHAVNSEIRDRARLVLGLPKAES